MVEHSLTQSVQDYLKAVYRLSKPGKTVSTNELAEELSVAPASVTGMLRRLSKDGYVDYTPRQGAELTAKGLEVALEIIRHHRLLEAYFVQRLGMDWAQAHQEAEILEHFISEELENLIDKELGYPEEDPHGAPIPGRDGRMAERQLVPLAEAVPGVRYVVRRVRAESLDVLDYLKQVKLVPGAEVVLMAVGPFDGPVSLKIHDSELHLGQKVASAVQVEELVSAPARSDSKPDA